MTTKEECKEEFSRIWSKKSKIEKFCCVIMASVFIPWMLGLLIAAATIEPSAENFAMIFSLMFCSIVALIPFAVLEQMGKWIEK